MAQLKQYYQEKIVPQLSQELGFDNTMRVPKITKVVLNMGLGEAVADKKILENRKLIKKRTMLKRRKEHQIQKLKL